MAEKKDNLDKLEQLSKVLAAILIPLMLAIVGNWYTSAIKQRELDARFAEVALGILARPPASADAADRSVREWAARLVSQYSGLPLGEEATRSVVDKTTIPLDTNSSYEGTTRYVVGAGSISLGIVVGNGQLGASVVRLNDQPIAPGQDGKFVIGQGGDLIGKILTVSTVVTVTNPATRQVSVQYTLNGGQSDMTRTISGPVSDGVARLRWTVPFVGSGQ